ncbi:unnamed protein product, partial [Phaeothamnion confervicola]
SNAIWPQTFSLAEGVLAGDRIKLSRAITLIESQREDHRRQADLLMDYVLAHRRVGSMSAPGHERSSAHPPKRGSKGGPNRVDLSAASSSSGSDGRSSTSGGSSSNGSNGGSGNSSSGVSGLNDELGLRLGIAGPPGAGKSTFIESLGSLLTSRGQRVAVVSVDPSSVHTGGSILGDKTRMAQLARDPNAFVRACPTRGVLGGVAQYTSDVVLLFQAAGYEAVIVETVGLGQSEVEVEQTVDVLLLLLPPAAGDDLQASRARQSTATRGDLAEHSNARHLFSDGTLAAAARRTACDYESSMRTNPRKFSFWQPPVLRCSAISGEGVPAVWEQVCKFRDVLDARGLLRSRRLAQGRYWMRRQLQALLADRVMGDAAVAALEVEMNRRLVAGEVTPRAAAERLAEAFV